MITSLKVFLVFQKNYSSQQLQAVTGQEAGQPGLSGIEALKRMPFTQEQVAQLQSMPEEQRNQILQRLQQHPEVQKLQQPRQPISLQEAIRKGGGATGSGALLEKEAGIQKRHEQNLEFKKGQEQEKVAKSTREFSKEYQTKAEAAKANKRDYNLLIDTAKRGELRSGNTAAALDKLGLSGFNRNFDTQLAEKVIARLGQNVSGAFGTGSRLTNYLEQTFQRSLPNLWNTPEGMIAVASINMLSDQVNEHKNEIRQDILKETGGKVPYDIEDEIERRVAPFREKYEDMGLSLARHFAEGSPISPPSAGDFFPINGAKWKGSNGEVLEVIHNTVHKVKKGK